VKTIVLLIFLAFIFSIYFRSNTLQKKVNGKIMVDSLPSLQLILSIKVVKKPCDDMQGAFVIDVREGDVLLFSSECNG
jgi:hypothetical protein